MRRIIFAAIFIVLTLIACAQQNTELPPRQTPGVPDTPETPSTSTQNAATVEPDTNKADAEVEALFARNDQVKSYSFGIAELPDLRGSHTYYIKGDKARVDPVGTVSVGNKVVHAVYLDLAKQTAVGYCARGRSTCVNPNEPVSLDYSDYEIILPHEWIPQIKYGEKVGTVTFNNKLVTRVAYEADGKYYEAYVDNFFGMPQRVAISSNPEMTQIVGGYEYRNMAFNTVQDSDVVYQPET